MSSRRLLLTNGTYIELQDYLLKTEAESLYTTIDYVDSTFLKKPTKVGIQLYNEAVRYYKLEGFNIANGTYGSRTILLNTRNGVSILLNASSNDAVTTYHAYKISKNNINSKITNLYYDNTAIYITFAAYTQTFTVNDFTHEFLDLKLTRVDSLPEGITEISIYSFFHSNDGTLTSKYNKFESSLITNPSTQSNFWKAIFGDNAPSTLNTIKTFREGTATSETYSYNDGKQIINRNYAPSVIWTAGDTFGYLSIPYGSSANVRIGGGNASGGAGWNAKLYVDDKDLVPKETNKYYVGTSSYRFYNGYFSNIVYAANGFYESSDERLKNFKHDLDVDLDKIAKLPKKYFTWKTDDENNLQIGTSAQELEKLYPELVTVTEEGFLNVAYDKLSIIALAAIDKLNDKVKSLEQRLEKLESLVKN